MIVADHLTQFSKQGVMLIRADYEALFRVLRASEPRMDATAAKRSDTQLPDNLSTRGVQGPTQEWSGRIDGIAVSGSDQ